MKNNVITFTYGMFIIVCMVVIAMLIVVMTDTADAKSINQREWLLKYEQISGYPAPAEEPTAAYTSGYPAPALEPTAKPKKKQEPEPTATANPKSPWDVYCEANDNINWCVDPSTRPPFDDPYRLPPHKYFPEPMPIPTEGEAP
jgi:hypothetical protein